MGCFSTWMRHLQDTRLARVSDHVAAIIRRGQLCPSRGGESKSAMSNNNFATFSRCGGREGEAAQDGLYVGISTILRADGFFSCRVFGEGAEKETWVGFIPASAAQNKARQRRLRRAVRERVQDQPWASLILLHSIGEQYLFQVFEHSVKNRHILSL